MTRFNLAIVVLLALAVAGLFFWTLQIRQEQSGTGSPGRAVDPGPPGGSDAARFLEIERSVLDLREMVRAQGTATTLLDQRVSGMEVSDAERDRRIAALARGEAVPEAAAPPDDSVLRTAIEQVLDRRAEEERQQRLERMARGMMGYTLGEVSASDAQREEFVKIMVAYIEGRDRVRRASEEPDRSADSREADLAALEATRDAELLRVFGEADLLKIQERLSRGRRGGEGRPGGGPDSFGPGRASPRPR